MIRIENQHRENSKTKSEMKTKVTLVVDKLKCKFMNHKGKKFKNPNHSSFFKPSQSFSFKPKTTVQKIDE